MSLTWRLLRALFVFAVIFWSYLIQLGLVARTARGRVLNAGGWKHLGLNPPVGSQDGLFDLGG